MQYRFSSLCLVCICACLLTASTQLPAFAEKKITLQESRSEIRDALSFEKSKAKANNDDLETKGYTIPDAEGKGVSHIAPDSYGINLAGKPISRSMILFDVDSSRIRTDESLEILKNYADVLRYDHPEAVLTIVGHTDWDGTDEHNWGLSQRRAESVKHFLVSAYGIDPGRLQLKWFGEDEPIATNRTAAGKQKNRRVEFVRVE